MQRLNLHHGFLINAFVTKDAATPTGQTGRDQGSTWAMQSHIAPITVPVKALPAKSARKLSDVPWGKFLPGKACRAVSASYPKIGRVTSGKSQNHWEFGNMVAEARAGALTRRQQPNDWLVSTIHPSPRNGAKEEQHGPISLRQSLIPSILLKPFRHRNGTPSQVVLLAKSPGISLP